MSSGLNKDVERGFVSMGSICAEPLRRSETLGGAERSQKSKLPPR